MTSIVLYENIQSQPYIYNNNLGNLVDERRLTFFPGQWLETTKNTVVVGGVQSGKTAYIINLVDTILQKGQIPIVVASNEKNILDQYKTRCSNEMNTITKEIKSKLDVRLENLHRPVIYTAILSPMRLKTIQELILHGISYYRKKFILIVDEGDLSIKDIDCTLEQIQRQMDQLGPYLKRIYITATPFAVLNSKAISPNIEEFTTIPSNYYPNLEYRNYYNMIHRFTDHIDQIASLKEEDLTEDMVRNFSSFLEMSMYDKVSVYQPNIGLFKVFRENSPKHILAINLSRYLPCFYILTYTGEGCTLYSNSQKKGLWKNGLCIARILQELKNDNVICPILIISYNMAGRAQTFKSEDRAWVLTHFFIHLPEKSSVEQTVQAMRCNGQYKPSDPISRIYTSKQSHDRLDKLITNNEIYIKDLGDLFRQNGKIDKTFINRVPLLKIPSFKFSTRTGVDDTSIIKSNDDGNCITPKDCEIMVNYLVSKNNCIGWCCVTYGPLCISRQEILRKVEFVDRDLFIRFSNSGSEAFKGLSGQSQQLLRNWIREKCQIQTDGCQIGYYAERSKELNKLHHLKTSKQFKARVIAEILSNGDISVIVYDTNYYHYPERYSNMVLVWLDTKGVYHLHVNKPDANYKLMFLTHTNF
jgi:hypothetical protein